MRYAGLTFKMQNNDEFCIQGKESLYTYQNIGSSTATIEASNDSQNWVEILQLNAGATTVIEHSYVYLRLIGDTTVLVNRGEGNNTNDSGGGEPDANDFKTINGESIVGSGDIVVGGGDSGAWETPNHFQIIPSLATSSVYFSTSRARLTSNVTTDVDNMYLMPFSVSIDITATIFGLTPAVSDSTGTKIVKLFVYTSNIFGQPFFRNAIFSSSVMDTWVSGQVSQTSCSIELKAGEIYWLLIKSEGGAMAFQADSYQYVAKTFLSSAGGYRYDMYQVPASSYTDGGYIAQNTISLASPSRYAPILFMKGYVST